LLLAVSVSASAQFGKAFQPGCSAPHFPMVTSSLPIDASCGITGTGVGADAEQDKRKNNFCAAPATTVPISFADLQNLQNQVEANPNINFGNPLTKHPLRPAPGPTKDRTPLDKLGEGKMRSIEGFVMIARPEGPETVNCGSHFPKLPQGDTAHDIHISIVPDAASAHGDECQSVVVEMISHHRPDFWSVDNVLKVAQKSARVRVTGQLFFDSSHTRCVGGKPVEGDPSRFTNWEIHPIYTFEVCSGNCSVQTNWLSLEAWLAKN
jgi:hypothetical protein